MERQFTHIDANGNAVMVDVSGKEVTSRTASAVGRISMSKDCFDMVAQGRAKKGDVLGVARVAGIMAAKRTAEWIPLCHPIPLDSVEVSLEPFGRNQVRIISKVHTVWRTGVEMEAMTAVSAAALTIYDMCKGIDRGMEIGPVVLLEKSGGRSGHFVRDGDGHA